MSAFNKNKVEQFASNKDQMIIGNNIVRHC